MSEPTAPHKRVLNAPFAALVLTRHPAVAELVASGLYEDIKLNGIRNDPLVRELEDGKREVLAGNGRATVWKSLGHDTIRVVCLGKLTKAQALAVVFKDHQLTRKMPLEEKLKYLVEMKATKGCTMAEAGAALGLSPAQTCKVSNIKHLDPELLPLAHNGTIPESSAYLLTTVRDREKQRELGRRVAAKDLTREELDAEIRKLRGGKARRPKALPVGTRVEKTAAGFAKMLAWFKAGAAAGDQAMKLDIPDSARVEMVLAKLGKGAA